MNSNEVRQFRPNSAGVHRSNSTRKTTSKSNSRDAQIRHKSGENEESEPINVRFIVNCNGSHGKTANLVDLDETVVKISIRVTGICNVRQVGGIEAGLRWSWAEKVDAWWYQW